MIIEMEGGGVNFEDVIYVHPPELGPTQLSH